MQMYGQFSHVENNDMDEVQVAHVLTHNDIKKEVMLITPYGFYHNPMPNALVVAQNMESDSSGITGVATDPNNRVKGLSESEVAVGNPYAGTIIHFKDDGTINVTSSWEVNVNAPTVNVIADEASVTATDATVTASILSISATTLNITGAVNINGSLSLNGLDFGSHVHGGVENGIGTTGGPA